ncbi:TadE family protein [Paludisphaera soli]|uniref:TadE family protein n=1 Tax=Paludisphaera soli TaxID=2712865 RepID=UPI0013E9B046|nr:TadE family protein [Paludisphaera soli]
MIRRDRQGRGRLRRGVVLVEAAIVYPVFLMLILGTIVMGLGIFRYHQVTYVACESARWASVRGPAYRAETNQAAPTTADVLTYARGKLVGMDSNALTGSLTMSTTSATVTLQYQWVPEAYFPAITFTSTATAPITY